MVSMKRMLFVAALVVWSGAAHAQDTAAPAAQATDKKPEAAAPQAATPQAATGMSPAAVGDHWVYDLIDDITGEVKEKRSWLVTDVTPTEITCRTQVVGSDKFGSVMYDPSWNLLRNGGQRFSPNDGGGIPASLEVNKSWSFQVNRLDPTGQVWKKTGQSHVVSKESITTKAGQFDVYVIETKFVARNTNNPTQKSEITMKLWYSPAINHWVKRSTISSNNGHVVQRDTLELTSYGRKKA
jgi:hypothetical protein